MQPIYLQTISLILLDFPPPASVIAAMAHDPLKLLEETGPETEIRYIKLGRAGGMEEEALREGELRALFGRLAMISR